MQVTNNNVIRVSKSKDGGKLQEKAVTCGERRIELVVGGKVTATLASWREEQLENNNREEKIEEKEGAKNEEAEVNIGLVEELKEEKRREQYRRIQEFKRKKNEEKSILRKRRLEEGKVGGTVEPFDIVEGVYRDQSRMEHGEGEGRTSQHGLSLAKHEEKASLSMGERKHPMVKKSIEEGLQIRTDLARNNINKSSQAEDKSASLSLAATLAGLEDLLAEDTTYVDSLPDSREEILDRVFKDSARLPSSTTRPNTPMQACLTNATTDLLQAAMSETFTSGHEKRTGDAGLGSVKLEKAASTNRSASLCNNKGNVYSIKQEVLDGIDFNIKKEPLDPVMTSSANNDLASFFSDFGVAVVKTEPMVPPDIFSALHMDEDDGEVLFLSSSCQESGLDMVSKCSICFLTFQDGEALAKHIVGQHSAAASLVSSSLKSRVKASNLPTLSLTRVPLPPSFKRKVQHDLGVEQASKVAKVEKVISTSSSNFANGIQEPSPLSELAIESPGQSNGCGRTPGPSSQLSVEHPNMTTLQALDSLLGGGPASEPEVACPVCGKQGYAS